MLDYLQKKNIHVVGISGAEGAAVARFLGAHVDAHFTFHDFSSRSDFKKNFYAYHDAYSQSEKREYFKKIEAIDAVRHFNDSYLEGIESADVIFVPQAWFRYEQNKSLEKHADKLSSMTQLYFEIASCKIIGVTGTAGKSTTSQLVHSILSKAGIDSLLAGNERKLKQDLEAVLALPEDGALVLEMSHRQLKSGLRKSPDIAIVTNIFPHHKDDAASFEEYAEIKKSIFAKQKADQSAILNSDDALLKNVSSSGVVYSFSLSDHGDDGAFMKHEEIWLRKDGREKRICATRDLKLKGGHNIMNVLAASFAAYEFGIGTKDIRRAVTEFESFGSRLQELAVIDGVRVIDDSKGGSSLATIAAIQAYSKPKVLIAGGTRKDISDTEFYDLAEVIASEDVKAVVLIGKLKKEIAQAVALKSSEQNKNIPVIFSETLHDAVESGLNVAEKGDVLLFSPACESFDMFSDYRERTREFRRIINEHS